MTLVEPAGAWIDQLRPVTLDELDTAASLQERMDRKYILTGEQLGALVEELAGRLAVLEIDGRRRAAYASTYFDTVDLESHRAAAHRRRHRWKVRTRTYLDTATTMLEVKTKGRRGRTVKRRRPHEAGSTVLGERGRRFVDESTGIIGLGPRLVPALTTEYDRTTLADLDDIARLTVDARLRCTDRTGRSVVLRERVVVETKSPGAPSVADRWRWAAGLRPQRISKFGTGLAALRPDLPSNKWHRTLTGHPWTELGG